jgi:hypothetical protein
MGLSNRFQNEYLNSGAGHHIVETGAGIIADSGTRFTPQTVPSTATSRLAGNT